MLVSIQDIIKESVSLYKQHGRLFLSYVWLLCIPFSVATVLGTFISEKATAGVSFHGPILYALAGSMFLLSIVTLWLSIAFTRVLADTYNKKHPDTVKISLGKAIPKIFPIFVASLLVFLIVLAGFTAFVVPGILFSIWFGFVFHEIVLNNKPVLASLHESKLLVSGRWWPVCVRILVPAIIFGLGIFAVQSVLSFLFNMLEIQYGFGGVFTRGIVHALTAMIVGFVAIFSAPLTLTAPTILFIELQKHPLEKSKKT